MQQALNTLNHLISQNVEYPDAEFKASTTHKVDASELRAAYDHQQSLSPSERQALEDLATETTTQ